MEWNNGESFGFTFCAQLFEFPFGQEKLPVPLGLMVVKRTMGKFGNVHVADIQAIIQKTTEGIIDIGFALPDGFDLCTQQPYASNISIQDMVLKMRSFVLDLYVCRQGHY